jgi:hypothetical protein
VPQEIREFLDWMSYYESYWRGYGRLLMACDSLSGPLIGSTCGYLVVWLMDE